MLKKIIAMIIAAAVSMSAKGTIAMLNPVPSIDPKPQEHVAPVIDEAEDGFIFRYEKEENRLYWMSTDGSRLKLILDEPVEYCTQNDEYAAYMTFCEKTHRLYMLNLKTGREKKVIELPEKDYISFRLEGNKLIYSIALNHSIPYNSVYIYDFSRSKSYELLGETDDFETKDGCLIYEKTVYEDENSEPINYFAGYDIEKGREVWRVYAKGPSQWAYRDGRLYLLDVDENTWGIAWTARDVKTGAKVPLDYDLKPDEIIEFEEPEGYFVMGRPDGTFTFVTGEGRTVYCLHDNEHRMFSKVARCGDKILVSVWGEKYYKPLDRDVFSDEYYILDINEPGMKAVTLKGEYGSMFKDGEFPIMDSSTARQPVTNAIYSFFCENRCIDGTPPLCSKTHGAWLNIADRKADIALLAAPTAEEKGYLAKNGVKVEMKLYGGDGLVFIGSKECGVENLTLEQLRQIFRGRITNWRELGGADHPIRVLYRDDQSGSQRLFEKLLWKDEEVPDLAGLGFERLDEMSTIVWECLDDPYAIGYSIMTYLQDVYDEESLLTFSLEGVAPAAENVANGSYPLSTQGYVVIRSDEAPDSPARRLYDWFGSPTCDTLLRQNSVTPLHE